MFTDAEYKELAILSIYNYFNGRYSKDYIDTNFGLAIKVFINNIKQISSSKVAGVKSMTEGSQSISFSDGVEAFTLTADVLALLPKKVNFYVW